jgi:phosphoglycolate phosphatase-like HAD superfamily hydrolase
MKPRHLKFAAVLLAVCFAAAAYASDPLPSWNEGVAKQAILTFADQVTDSSRPTYVEAKDRIATIDNDGTLWVEHPMYTQALFALDRVVELAPRHPEWKEKDPFKAVIAGDREAIAKFTGKDWMELVAATHSEITTTEFHAIVGKWLAEAKHPRFKRPFTELVYQPMLELMEFLRSKGFRTFIVTGGGQDFVRVFAERIYGVPPEQVIGSSFATKYECRDGKPVLVREPKIFFVDDRAGKAVGIDLFIGKRPYVAVGNSTGDREMLEWTTAGEGARLGMLVLHDDADREYAYGPALGLPDSKVGTFTQELSDEALKKGWTVISMKKDWNRIFPEWKAK